MSKTPVVECAMEVPVLPEIIGGSGTLRAIEPSINVVCISRKYAWLIQIIYHKLHVRQILHNPAVHIPT